MIATCIIAILPACVSSLHAEKKFETYCDNLCGDTTKCTYTCCTITKEQIGGAEVITALLCSNNSCCAHPLKSSVHAGSQVTVPANAIEGVAGPVKASLAGASVLDASTIKVQADKKTRTVTLSGTVRSPAQLRVADSIANREASGYKVINELTIASK